MDDMEEPLTPSHLIVGRRIRNLPDHLSQLEDIGDEEFPLNPNQLTRRMKHLANVQNHFWNHWRSEYLNELREVHSYTARKQSKSEHSIVAVDDIVIVHDEHLPRGLWKLGKIVSVMKGRDGFIRGATVKIGNRDGQEVLLNRPIQLLYPLEVQSQEPVSGETRVVKNPATENDPVDITLSDNPVQIPPDDKPADSRNVSTTSGAPRRSNRAAAKRADANRMACMFKLKDN